MITIVNRDTGIDELHAAFLRAFAEADVDAILDLFTPDYVLLAPGGEPVPRDALRPMLEAALEAMEIRPSFDRQELIVSGDLAVEWGDDVQEQRPRAGGPAVVRRQRVMVVLRRGADGSWRFARGMAQGRAQGT